MNIVREVKKKPFNENDSNRNQITRDKRNKDKCKKQRYNVALDIIT